MTKKLNKKRENILIFGNNTKPKISKYKLNKIIKNISKMEKKHYPSYMLFLQNKSILDIAKYAECDVDNLFIYYAYSYYLIFCVTKTHLEIIDLCGKLTPSIFIIFKEIMKYAGNKPILYDARIESLNNKQGSYKLSIKYAEKLGYKIIYDQPSFCGLEENMRTVILIKKDLNLKNLN